MLRRRIFRVTSWLVAAFGLATVLLFILAVGFDATPFGDSIMDIAVLLICSGFPLAIVMAIAGLGLRTTDKQKREYVNEFVDEDKRLDRIMKKLSTDEKEYLNSLIASKRMGIADDGELTTLNDLLDDDDDNQRINLVQ